MKTLLESASTIQNFQKDSLTKRISTIEHQLSGADIQSCLSSYESLMVSDNLLVSALAFKKAASQINVLIHAVGILLSLPHILNDGEIVESLSLGAGNSGRKFDLETNQRVAEYKFISWKGGAEAIRQNSLFKDFYFLAEDETPKKKYLYVIGLDYPTKFFNSNRAFTSILSKNNKLWIEFQEKYGERFNTVHQYYEYRKDKVNLEDISKMIPQFLDLPIK